MKTLIKVKKIWFNENIFKYFLNNITLNAFNVMFAFFLIMIIHLANAFIQNDLQMRNAAILKMKIWSGAIYLLKTIFFQERDLQWV